MIRFGSLQMDIENTRATLILKIRDNEDSDSWNEISL